MLDRAARKLIDPPLNAAGTWLARRGASADAVTLAGLILGLVAAAVIWAGAPALALIPLRASRLADGLDGAVARATHKTDFGGYLDIAAELRPELETIDGFLSVERFQSLTTPGKYLSLSFWRDEAALTAWRNRAVHRRAQSMGRTEMFRDYRLRVAGVIRDYGMFERAEAPADSTARHG